MEYKNGTRFFWEDYVFQNRLEVLRSLNPVKYFLEPDNLSGKESNESSVNMDAEFIGWQEFPSGKMYALYNVTAAKHPLYHSTVTAKTLLEHNLNIPSTPLSIGSDEKLKINRSRLFKTDNSERFTEHST